MKFIGNKLTRVTLFTIAILFKMDPSFSQNILEINVNEIEFTVNNDTTTMTASKNGVLLNGRYKMIIDKRNETYALTDFVDGKGQGRSDSFRKGVLVGSTELKNGLPNGYKITYDMTGKNVMWKMQMVNGVRHGHTWWADKGDTYFFKGKEVSKEEFERRTKNN